MNLVSLESWFDKHSLSYPKFLAVGVSGGPDSMALAALLVGFCIRHKIYLYLLTVNHGLREAAKIEAQMVAEWVKAQDNPLLTHHILNWEGEKPAAAIMESARTARYDLMAAYCGNHDIPYLCIAHHQDDQAETFLIRLAKGSGLDGLGGMQEVRDYSKSLKILRPLLDVPKNDLISYCQQNNIPFINDPSNENTDYLRPRLRQSMEILAAEGLSAKRLSLTAKRLSRVRQALEEIASQALQKSILDKSAEKISFNFDALKEYPAEIGFRVIQKALEDFREDAAYNVRMEKLEDLFESLWSLPDDFKPRTLGGCVFALKLDKLSENTILSIEKEAPKA